MTGVSIPSAPHVPTEAVRALLHPRSIAIVGASADETKAGGRPLRYLREMGFSGRIYPINPNRADINGLKCYRSLAEVGDPIDLCVLAVSADQAEKYLETCGQLGIKSAIVFASGFAEVGPAGRERQARLADAARAHDIAVVGPNCMGFIDFRGRVAVTFTTALERRGDMPAGHIAFITQSGAIGAFVLALAQDQQIGFSYFITAGNEAVLGFADYADALLDDPDTRVIAGYLEGLDGRRLVATARAALSADKPLVLMKVGSSAAGAAASAAHTGKLVGSELVYDAVFKQYGIVRAESVEQLLDFANVLTSRKPPCGPRVAVVSISGGAAILIADWCDRLGLQMPAFSEATTARLRQVLPWFSGIGNPVDTTGRPLWDADMLGDTLAAVAADTGVDMVLCHIGLATVSAARVSAEVVAAAGRTAKPVLVTWAPENDPRPQQELRRAGVAIFSDPVRMVRAAHALLGYAEAARRGCTPPGQPGRIAGPAAGAVVTEDRAKRWLGEHGLRLPRERIATSADEAVQLAGQIGFPVVAKVISPDILHRSDVGGVRLDLRDPEAVRQAFRQVSSVVPGARIDGVLIGEQLPPGLELIISGFRDPDFGPCVLCGVGGIYAEILSDTAVRQAPIDPDEATVMLRGLRGSALFSGARGGWPADLDAASHVLARLSELIASCPEDVSTIEINPLVVYPAGKGAVVLDALIVRKESN
jgi:acyl-CoA synthetase (NDP forming)